MFSPLLPLLPSMVSAQQLLVLSAHSPHTCTEETKGMDSLETFVRVRILLFQSATEGCVLGHIPFLMHGFKFSSSVPDSWRLSWGTSPHFSRGRFR